MVKTNFKIAAMIMLCIFISIIAFTFGAMAANNVKTIDVTTGVNIMIDGKEFVPKDANGKSVEVFIYNGTTYVPIRAVTELFGKQISYDAATDTVFIGEVTKEVVPPISEKEETIVYVTETGSKYHRSGCRYLSKSKIAISLSEAKKSYTPCSVCW